MVNRLVGAVVVDLLAVQRDGAAGLLTDAEQGLHDVGAFSAHQAGDTENFALMQVKGDIANGGLAQRGEIAHLEDHFARSVFAIRKTLVKRTPDHHGDDLIHIQPFQRLGGDPLAVAQDGYFIAQLENFFHFMRDIDDTAAAIFQLTDDLKQMVDLFFRQR